MYGIADLDNCYVSCERVFRPDLKGVPVVVLSNNDGCVVARSNEAKAIGVKEGTPYYQLAELFPNNKIAVFSSNYELYGELTGRVISIIRKETPAYFRYSIDECFMYLDGIALEQLQTWGERLQKRVKREVGIPISIGLAPNKTLAKIASKLAKKFEAYNHCCMIDTDYKRERALEWCPIDDVWGIGRRYAAKLQSLGCKTALDFAKHHKDWVRQTFNDINIVRTWQELNGEDAVPNEELAKKKSICTSRSFNGMIDDFETLRTNVSNYAARCSEKLRLQNTVATTVGVFVNTNAFREDLAQYWNFQETRLITPTNSTIPIVSAACDVLQKIFRQGYKYKKAGVIVMGIGPESPIQQDLFDLNAEQIEKMRRLDKVIDRINRLNGSETIVIGAQQYTLKETDEHEQNQNCMETTGCKHAKPKIKVDVFANAIKHDFKSPNPTTRWSDIIKLK
ncbi:Y-family DNA polymerase [Prevotella sp. E9-3]|uniref:Y-family DNA polymerase n=1 Tax=Prevotella sp. E9-3 TaxID=2913621 RepID=UPI001EDB90A3|nr:Y-family DNA polymerase [Prevotella sp. E9-3]UKK47160.1 Y-family DNA polymerase [Prevotella sp. E9-3]